MQRALILLVPLALVLGACGDDDDDAPELTTPDVSLPDLTLPDLTLPDVTVPDLSIPDISMPDLSDISVPDLTIPGGSIPEMTEESEQRLRDALAQTGLDEEQTDCVVESARDLGGEDFDPSEMTGLFDDCNIELTDLQPGG